MTKYKVSTFTQGKIRQATVEAKNMKAAQNKAAKKWGKSPDVGHFSVNRVRK